jgi:hypothetical protein
MEIHFGAGVASLRLRDVPVSDAHDLYNNLTNGQGYPPLGVLLPVRDSRPTASKSGRFNGQIRGWKSVKPTASTGFLERAMGIEPISEAWEDAGVVS